MPVRRMLTGGHPIGCPRLYDTHGHLTSVYITDARSRNITFTTDAQGQILTRAEADNVAGGDPKTFSFYFGGVLIGEVSNDGLGRVSYGAAINNRGVAQSGSFKAGDSGERADFDQSYDPINPGSSGEAGAASRYAVRDGDTLQGVAAALWGDASLWYVLAEANGLSAASSLTAGQSLIIPNKVANLHNTASTFRPYVLDK